MLKYSFPYKFSDITRTNKKKEKYLVKPRYDRRPNQLNRSSVLVSYPIKSRSKVSARFSDYIYNKEAPHDHRCVRARVAHASVYVVGGVSPPGDGMI